MRNARADTRRHAWARRLRYAARIIGLITAQRRELLGEPDRWTQGGHRNHAVPFCLYTGAHRTPTAMRIDLNADVGESFGPYSIGDDPRSCGA